MSTQKLDQIAIGRAKNALLSLFEQRLSVPKIYLDAEWEGTKVDVLAIDRAGSGDVSVALIRRPDQKPNDLVHQLHSLQAHFKYWVAMRDFSKQPESSISDALEKFKKASHQHAEGLQTADDPTLFAEDGVGRIGQIIIDLTGGRSVVSVTIPPERFRSNQHIFDVSDAFAASHTADFEVRP